MMKPDLGKILTIYGRKPVLEALEDKAISVSRLHLADSNKTSDIIEKIIQCAHQRGIETRYHDKLSLSRISKNSQQDQGVALDINMPGFSTFENFINAHNNNPFRLLALDGITNPQNLGMIIRSVCASELDGLVLPDKGCAKLDSLVIKASAGTLFKCPIIRCKTLAEALGSVSGTGVDICCLAGNAKQSLFDYQPEKSCIYILGNETEGVSNDISNLSNRQLKIPMSRQIESLNVAIAASLVAFHTSLSNKNFRSSG